ncbi:MAG: DUF433 domain-containing protein [Chloroflexota bacterium]|jgi:uncharacterized protein (DUF433 family)|nr:DUF433 domain-containing protein [Chloroflexota bacterium]
MSQPRPIVRHPEVMEGRWHFEGTDIAIADIVRSYLFGFTNTAQAFQFCDLTREEIAAALAFDFPAIQEEAIELRPAMLVAHCVCGEVTTTITSGDDTDAAISCVCGRRWSVQLVVTPFPADLFKAG